MKAALVTSYAHPPRYTEVAAPTPTGPHEILVDVLAAGLHPRVRSQADGSHYTSTDELPLVPGIDGVGRGADGELRYFVLPDTTMGAMAEQTVVDVRCTVVLPADCDPVAVAAAMNPAMSSWVALRRRIDFVAGQDVLVLGATGNAGQLAVRVARRLGADRVVAAGRDADRLAALAAAGGAETVSLDGGPDAVAERVGAIAAEVDVVLDYLWGEPAVTALTGLVTHRTDETKPLTWIQIGSIAGATAALPSAALRSTRLQVVGSGQGSVSPSDIRAELADIAAEITRGTFAVETVTVPLADVEQAWVGTRPSTARVVLVP